MPERKAVTQLARKKRVARRDVLDGEMQEAIRRFIPSEAFGLLGKSCVTDVRPGDHVEKTMTILFSDIRDFTPLSERMSPAENFDFINAYFRRMESVFVRHNGIIDKYMGDAVMALFPTSPDDAVHCALEMLQRLNGFNNALKRKRGQAPIRVGIGLNTGLTMLGVVGGRSHLESTVISDAVNLAARIETLTKSYGTPLLISEHTYYGARNIGHHDTRFVDRVKVKGKEQPQSVYEVFDADPPLLREAKRRTKGLFEEALARYHMKEVPAATELLAQCLAEALDDTAAQVYRARCERFMETGVHESSGEFDLMIEWNPAVAVGCEEIDEQHRALFDFVKGLVQAIQKTRDLSEIRTAISFLDNYVAEHFTAEEKLMAEYDYPFLPMQVAEHQRFVDRFGKFKEEIRKNFRTRRNFLLFHAQILLIDWVVNHTSKLDRHFGRYLNRRDAER